MDEVNSSVRTSVKGVAYTNNRIWDTAEYAIPMQAVNSFFIMTNIIKTENQLEQRCPEVVSTTAIATWVGSCSSCGKSPFYKIYNRKKSETVLNPRQVMYVCYADEPHVTLIKKPLKTSSQPAQGSIVESHPVKFCDAGSCCTSESNENHDNEEYELGRPLRQGASSPDCQKWCCCGKCQPTQKYHEQLCCRRKKGQCITASHCFQQLVLSSRALKKALFYKDPFLDSTDGNINNQLHHLAYKQYIHWHLGFFDLEDRAIIPSLLQVEN